MLGEFSLLPWLKGWQYRTWSLEGVVRKGENPRETTISSNGWLNSILMATSDAFGTVRLIPMHLNQCPTVSIYPDWPYALGTMLPSSIGWLPKYFRPDLARSFGSYVILVGPESRNLPFIAPTKVQILLGDSSTESSAYISCLAAGVEIVDKDSFMASLAELPVFRKSEADVDMIKAVGKLAGAIEVLTLKVKTA